VPRPALLLLAATAILTATAGLGPGPTAAQAPARAVAGAALVAGSPGRLGELRSRGDGRGSDRASVRADSVRVRRGELRVFTSRAGGEGVAEATAAARTVTLLDGAVTAYGVRRRLVVRAGRRTYSGRVSGLEVDGRKLGTVTGPRGYRLEGGGVVRVNTGASGITVQLAARTIRVAHVTASARDGADPAATPAPTPTATPRATRTPAPTARRGDGSKARPTPRAVRRRPPRVPERLTARRFAFPVYGSKVTIGGPFGADRPQGAHQGNDVFAPFGAPVLAVTDGVLFKVGTLPVSGNRLWLRSDAGDEFFYAHLSAFAPAAVNGRRVKAGQVLGFTGNTGDAEPTPPHVHFEIHPGGGDAIDPEPILTAWRERRDVPPGAWLTRYGRATERPGALVEVRDLIGEE